MPSLRRIAPLLVVAGTLACAAPLRAQVDPQRSRERLHHALYLQREEGRAADALALLRALVDDPALAPGEREQARIAIEGLEEELAAADLAALMPPEAFLYAELVRPGAHLRALLDRIGLLGEEGGLPSSFAISPLLVRAAFGLRGAAVAVTRLDERGEPAGGVLVVHPGEQELVRGLLETAIPAEGSAEAPCEGFPVYRLEGGLAMLTRRLVVLATDRAELEGVALRLEGRAPSSLALASPLRERLPRTDSTFCAFYVHGEPLRPWIGAALRRAEERDPDARSLRLVLDPESLESASGVLALADEGLELDVELELRAEHASLAFHLARLPALDPALWTRVPAGSAGALALALNPPGRPGAPLVDASGRAVVSALDLGRELFSNLQDLALFALPAEEGAGAGPPPLVLSLRVADVQRSLALWRFGLALAAGRAGEPAETVEVAGREAQEHRVGGLSLVLLPLEGELCVSPSRAALERALAARAAGRTLRSDPELQAALEALGEPRSLACVVHLARTLALAGAYARGAEAERLQGLAEALARTTIGLGLAQDPTQLALRARLRSLPDLSGLVRSALRTERSRSAAPREAAAVPAAPAGSAVAAASSR